MTLEAFLMVQPTHSKSSPVRDEPWQKVVLMKNDAARILQRLQAKGASALELLPILQDPAQQALWQEEPQLYRAFARKLIDEGHPTRAFELAREGLASHPNDRDLQYVLALALARGGNLRSAEAHLAPLVQGKEL